MVDHLKNLIQGATGLFALYPRQYRVDRNGFAEDAKRLRGDFAAVGRELREQIKRESANYRSR